jgi:hypothetical protein
MRFLAAGDAPAAAPDDVWTGLAWLSSRPPQHTFSTPVTRP